MSATLFLSMFEDLTIPKLACNGTFVGPFVLSIHPGIGSFHVLITMQQKKMSIEKAVSFYHAQMLSFMEV
jgi:hypothetical protein